MEKGRSADLPFSFAAPQENRRANLSRNACSRPTRDATAEKGRTQQGRCAVAFGEGLRGAFGADQNHRQAARSFAQSVKPLHSCLNAADRVAIQHHQPIACRIADHRRKAFEQVMGQFNHPAQTRQPACDPPRIVLLCDQHDADAKANEGGAFLPEISDALHVAPLTSRRITMTAPDYQTLIDAETWAFIARTDACYPPDTASMGIADQRRIYDGMCRLFHQGYPAGIGAQDSLIAGVPCRSYAGEGLAKTGPKVLYLHGGGFVVGGLDSHDDVCAEICAETGLTVVAADYRLSPEHDHPAAFDDAMAVACSLGEPILLVGDSAGGNLAAAVA